MRYKYYNSDPRVIRSRYVTRCAETGREIKKGEECLYYPAERKVYCLESKQAEDWGNMKEDEEILNHKYPY